MPVNPIGVKTLYRIKKRGKPNTSNLKNQWDKTRYYVGGYPKYGVRRQMLIILLTMPRWILTEPLLRIRVIINGPNCSPSNLR